MTEKHLHKLCRISFNQSINQSTYPTCFRFFFDFRKLVLCFMVPKEWECPVCIFPMFNLRVESRQKSIFFYNEQDVMGRWVKWSLCRTFHCCEVFIIKRNILRALIPANFPVKEGRNRIQIFLPSFNGLLCIHGHGRNLVLISDLFPVVSSRYATAELSSPVAFSYFPRRRERKSGLTRTKDSPSFSSWVG